MKMSLGKAMAIAAMPVLLLAAGAGSASARPASGNPPPPKGLEAQSASFVPGTTTGFVLGARNCSRTDDTTPCPAALSKTVNGGKTWTKVSVPSVALVQPYSAPPKNTVSTVRFENANDGWLFNPGLWATTNGGATWKSVTNLGGMVTNVAAADGEVFAVVRPWSGNADGARLWESAVGSGKWTKVAKVQPQITLTVFGHFAWTGLSPNIWTTTNSGKTWTKLSFSCRSDHPDSSPVAAASALDISIVCVNPGFPQPGSSQKMVYLSVNGGRKFTLTSHQPADSGEVYLLAMPVGKPKAVTIAAASGASYFYNTINNGYSWGMRTFFDGGTSFLDLGYVSSTTGYVIRFGGNPVIAYSLGLWKTTDGGGTWKHVSIP